jgi:hypothetical protein
MYEVRSNATVSSGMNLTKLALFYLSLNEDVCVCVCLFFIHFHTVALISTKLSMVVEELLMEVLST